MDERIVWLVYYDQSPADYVLEHVASTEDKARAWIDAQPMLEQRSLVTVAYLLDQLPPIRFPS